MPRLEESIAKHLGDRSDAESWLRYETIQPCTPQSCTSPIPRMSRAGSTTCADRVALHGERAMLTDLGQAMQRGRPL